MSKTVKKLLSVVLAVLVLAAGFSTMLSSFVMAEPEWTYNYDEIVPEFDGTKENLLVAHRAVGISNHIAAPDSFKFYDYSGIATNLSADYNNYNGIRMSEKFFSSKNEAAGGAVVYGGEAKDVHPYITYQVEPGTAFAVKYYTYVESQWGNFNLAERAKEFKFLTFLVSSDGVNFVPIEAENAVSIKPVTTGYDGVVATIDNVGATTKFIKVQFPFDPNVETQQKDKDGNWVPNFCPQDAIFIQKVKLSEPTNPLVQTVADFSNKVQTGTKENGDPIYGGFLAVDGQRTALNEFFFYSPFVNADYVKDAYIPFETDLGLRVLDYGRLGNSWGTYNINDRSYYLEVQPGSKFYLSVNTIGDHHNAATVLKNANKIDSVEDFSWQVYSAENLVDFKNGKATKHEFDPMSVGTQSTAVNFKYNFIVPENHTLIMIVDPKSGGLDTVTYDGQKACGNRGNDRLLLDTIVFTKPQYDITDDYYTNGGTGNTAEIISGFTTTLTKKIGLGQPGNNGKTPANTLESSPRTDDQLAYAVYNVQPGTLFSADITLDMGNNNYRKYGYDNVAESLGIEELYFEILTSSGNEIDKYVTYKTLGKKNKADDLYTFDTTYDLKRVSGTTYIDPRGYKINFVVPEGVNYIMIRSHWRGATKAGTAWCYFDDCAGIRSVSYTPVQNSVGVRTYDYMSMPYGGSNANAALNFSSADATKKELLGVYATKNTLQLENNNAWGNQGFMGGIHAIRYSGHFVKDDGTPNQDKSYLIYNVKPGTAFKATVSINQGGKKTFVDAGFVDKDFEMKFYISSTFDGTFTPYASTHTKATSGWVKKEVAFVVPEGVNFIKVEFPQTGGILAAESDTNVDQNKDGDLEDKYQTYWGQHDVMLNNVSFVPASARELAQGETFFNYSDTSIYPYGTGFNYYYVDPATKAEYYLAEDGKTKIYYKATDEGAIKKFPTITEDVKTGAALNRAAHAVENSGLTFDNHSGGAFGLTIIWKDLGSNSGNVARRYVIYKVEPGTLFTANLKVNRDCKYDAEEIDQAGKEDKDLFEFFFSVSDAQAGNYTVVAQSNTPSVNGGGDYEQSVTFRVPEDATYVKVEFPQTGNVNGAVKNHGARFLSASFVPADAEGIAHNNSYKGKADALANNNKTNYSLYNFNNIDATDEGLVANADDAFVIYKVSNAADLVIKSAADLDISVSYDGKNYVDAQITACQDTYTVMTIAEKVFVKVKIPNGETITGVTAATLTPTVTFIVPHMNKEFEVNVPYGAAATEPEVTARPGYEFDMWSDAFDKVWLDTETEYKYKKAATNYAITVENGAILKVGLADCEADTTEATARFDDRVVIEAPVTKDNLVFDKWVDAKGNTVSNSHKFSFLASGALALTAKYAEAKSDINPFIYNADSAMTTDNGDKWNMSVIWQVNVPANAVVTETGILISTGDLSDDEACKSVVEGPETDTIKKREHTRGAAGKSLMYTITGIKDGSTRYARPYARIIVDGETKTIFGKTVTADNHNN